jgi:hypothetical protein
VSEGGSVGEACEKEEGPEEWGKDEKEPVKSCPVVKGNLKITNHGAAEQIKDIHQALKRGRGQPWKVDVNTAEVHQKANSPGPGKGSVPYGGVGYCLGPERNGVSSGVGGEGGSGPSGEERNKHSNPSKEEGNMEQEEGGPACTE